MTALLASRSTVAAVDAGRAVMRPGFAKRWLTHLESYNPRFLGTTHSNHEYHMSFVRDIRQMDDLLCGIDGYTPTTLMHVGATAVPNYHLYHCDSPTIRQSVWAAVRPVIVEWLTVQVQRETTQP